MTYPLRIEGRVNYYDPGYNLFWLENNGVSTYLQLGPNPPALRQGQRVRIEGSLQPLRGLSSDTTTFKVLEENEPIVPLSTKGRIDDIVALNTKIVTVEAYVDGQQLIDNEHLRLYLVTDDRMIIGWVKPDKPDSLPNYQGCFVRYTGLYSGRFDPTGTQTTIEVWTAKQSDVEVLGALANYPGFDRNTTSISSLYQVPSGQEIKISGIVQSHDAGASLTIRDHSGQVLVKSVQRQRIPTGTEVDAVGYVAREAGRWILKSSLYRRTHGIAIPQEPNSAKGKVLESISQVRALSGAEAAKGHPVSLTGMVTWALPETDFLFLQDITGGIRVKFDPKKVGHFSLCKYIRLEGVTCDGGFAPEVELRSYKDLGAMNAPAAKPITYNQAITGKEDGQWVEMRGFVQRVESDHNWRWIYVTTPEGEFVALLQSPVNFVANPGSLIRVHGSCETMADRQGKITGVMLRVPFLHDFTIDEDAPADYYDLPLRTIQSLEQLNLDKNMTRARISGVVLHVVPGRYIFVQDKTAGIVLLTRETEPLNPGDSIEAVGILGAEGYRIVLREAVYRKLRTGSVPVAIPLVDPSQLSQSFDARLVSLRGNLIDVLRKTDSTRFTLQSGSTIYEALLEHPYGSSNYAAPAVGATLDLTGIYRSEIDDSHQLRGFKLQLRSPQDIVVYQQPRLWTLSRALIALSILAAGMLLSIIWGTTLRRRVRMQTEQLREQMEHQRRLEAGVQHAARLESLGALAGGMAHDFNNILSIVLGNLGLAMTNERAVAEVGEYLKEARKGVDRARELTRQLLTFSKGGSPIRASASLPEIVKDIAKASLAGSSVRCEYEQNSDLWNANVDKNQIAQAIQNILLNAVQAMKQGGVVRIILSNDEIPSGKHLGLAGGRYVKLLISDSGVGIGPDVQPRIFDPYFTTKKNSTGLGLSTVYSIIKKHQGLIEVESTPGKGATFHVWLPAIESTPEARVPVQATPPAAPVSKSIKSARVLLMDDEECIRRIAGIVLKNMGLDVTVASDGEDALRSFEEARQAGRPFELIILDLTIPGGMGGKEVIETIRKMDTSVPAIVSSGYSNDPVMSEFQRYGFQAMVQKPYEIEELAEAVKRLLSQRR